VSEARRSTKAERRVRVAEAEGIRRACHAILSQVGYNPSIFRPEPDAVAERWKAERSSREPPEGWKTYHVPPEKGNQVEALLAGEAPPNISGSSMGGLGRPVMSPLFQEKNAREDLLQALREQIVFLKQELRAAQDREREMRRELLAVLRPAPTARVEYYRAVEREAARQERLRTVTGRARESDETRVAGPSETPPWVQGLYADGSLVPPETELTPEEQAILETAEAQEADLMREASARAEGYAGGPEGPSTAEPEPAIVVGEDEA